MTAEVSETKRTGSAALVLMEYGYEATATSLSAKLLNMGVAKGTVCKMKTVLQALYDGKITANQVTSLNAAYNLVKAPSTEDQEVKFLQSVEPWADLRGVVRIKKQDLMNLFRAAVR